MSPQTAELFEKYVVPNYKRFPVALVRGEGSQVWDDQGRRISTFFPGWGCNLLGHCPPRVVEAVQEQVAELIHVPNTWHTEAQGRWAQMLSERSFGGKAFFCNSGAEANEAAIKLARLHTPANRYKIITFQGGFHGRTYGATSATAQPKYHEGIGPLLAGFRYAPFGDLGAVVALIDDETAAIMVEPIQGEGGIRIPPDGFLAGLRELADEHGLLLIFDEVQTGCGRTGEWFAYQHFGVTPDIMTLAKSLCGGIAGAALLTTAEIAPSLRPGMHAATFGGNPDRRPRRHRHARNDRRREPARARQAAWRTVPPAARPARRRAGDRRRAAGGRRDDRPGARRRRGADRRTLPRTRPVDQCHARHRDPAAAGPDAQRRELDEGCSILADVLRNYSPQELGQ